MHPEEILVGDLVEFSTGNFGRIVAGPAMPIGKLTAVVMSEARARVPVPIYMRSIVNVKRNGGDWVTVRHFKMENVFQ